MKPSDLVRARRGHFAFPSGFHGDLWLELDVLFAAPREVAPLAAELAARLPDADVVCGPMSGGALLRLGGRYAPAVPFAYLEELESGLWPADRCPLCAAGRVLDDPAAST